MNHRNRNTMPSRDNPESGSGDSMRQRWLARLVGSIAGALVGIPVMLITFDVFIEALGRGYEGRPNVEWWAPIYYLAPIVGLILMVTIGVLAGKWAHRRMGRR